MTVGGPTGAKDPLGRPIFRVVTDTRDKAASLQYEVVCAGERVPIFPPFLKTHTNPPPLRVVGDSVTWFRPSTLAQLAAIKAAMPEARLVAGNSEVGIDTKFKGVKVTALVSTQKVHEMAGGPFTIGSPKQLGDVLFEKLGLKGGRKGKSGVYSTDVNELERLAADGVPIARKVLEWRQLSKLKSTYTDALQAQINPATGRVHTS